MINGIRNISFTQKKSDNTFPYKYPSIQEEILIKKQKEFLLRNLFLTEENKDGTPKSRLSRVLTVEEAKEVKDLQANRLQTYIDFLDEGLPANDAAFIAQHSSKTANFRRLTQKDEDGNPQNGASRTLTEEEAVFYIRNSSHCLTPSKLQDFINLIDEGVSIKDTKRLLIRKSVLDRYKNLTKTDEQGNPKSGASRVLTPNEAVDFLSGYLEQNKIQNYIDLIDNGVSPKQAYFLAQTRPITEKFLSYIQTDEKGKPKSGLKRVLTIDEALYAINYKGNKHKMLHDIDNGLIKINKRQALDTNA